VAFKTKVLSFMSFGDPVRLGIGELFLELFFDALVFERPRREGRFMRTILSQTAVATVYRGENTSSVENRFSLILFLLGGGGG